MAIKTVKDNNMTLKVATFDAITGEYTDREMNAEELLEHEAKIAQEAARIAGIETKAIAKAALLERLGITAEEATLLLS